MIDALLAIIRYTPLMEKLVSALWSDYEAWRKEYDEQRIKDAVSKSLIDDSTTAINDEMNKK